MTIEKLTEHFGGNGVSFEDFHGFPAVRLTNEYSSALISLYGGHVVEFILPDTEPVLWMSKKSLFQQGSPMRGGVPICFPWFGAAPQGRTGGHGFVRNQMWEMSAAGIAPEGGTFATLHFQNDDFELFYTVTANRMLTLSLEVVNSGVADLEFSGSLHTYFNISDIEKTTVENLDGVSYLDTVLKQDDIQHGTLHIDREIDRIYRTCGSARIKDTGFNRIIHVDKYGSDSTVIWNPWVAKSQRMQDFGDEEFRTMLCIEAAKVPLTGDFGIAAGGMPYELRQVIRVELPD
ncbi:MAG: D-hexose-6-phosphate mutarotase [Lentisphaerae bacterium]|nr:D-hexose-6-phosphate mutarotase [Lentisphaerota bacterium]